VEFRAAEPRGGIPSGEPIQPGCETSFLVLALENKAHLIVSGDRHLLDLGKYKNVQIVTPSEAWDVLEMLLHRTK
jgi:hypothetical protein